MLNDHRIIIADKKDVIDRWESDNRTLFDENMQQSAYDDRHLKNVKRANRIGVSVDDNQIPDISCSNAPITRKEVVEAVKRLKLRKAAGIHNICAEVLPIRLVYVCYRTTLPFALKTVTLRSNGNKVLSIPV